MTARRPPQPEPPPRRKRPPARQPWRTKGPRGTTVTAERVMRARGESTCTRCHTTILVRQQIGLVDGDWIHVACLLGRTPMIGPHSGQ